MTKKKLYYTGIIVFTMLLMLVIGLSSISYKKTSIIPLTSEHLQLWSYHEGLDSNFSTVFVDLDAEKNIIFKYELTEHVEEPYVAVYVKHKDTASFFQLNNYNTLRLHLNAKRAKRIPITLTMNLEGFTSSKQTYTNVPFTTTIDLVKGKHRYEISFDKFELPSWWLRLHNNLKQLDIPVIDLNRINLLIIGSGQVLGPNIPDEIKISDATFFHSNRIVYYALGLLTLVCVISLVITNKLLNRKKVLIPYQSTGLSSQETRNELDQIVLFIGLNYHNDKLSLSDIQVELGISGKKISTFLKKEFNLSFKEYLNMIRLTEVKRLLLETGLSIAEIAHKSGYNDIPHFNRVFKADTGKSPKMYREDN